MEDNTPPVRLPVCGPTPLVLSRYNAYRFSFRTVSWIGFYSFSLRSPRLSHVSASSPTLVSRLSRLAGIQRRAASSTQAALEPSGSRSNRTML